MSLAEMKRTGAAASEPARAHDLAQLNLAQMTMPDAIAAMVDAWLDAQQQHIDEGQ